MNHEQRARAVVPMLYGPATPREIIEEDLQIRLSRYPTMRGTLYQAAAIPFWSSYRRLKRLRMPVLVMHGEKDRVLPPMNGRRLASRIPGAKLVMIPNAGHMLLSDAPDLAMGTILKFLEEVSG
jgi:pimeloyl-ACP methyl ester carboxylesterase